MKRERSCDAVGVLDGWASTVKQRAGTVRQRLEQQVAKIDALEGTVQLIQKQKETAEARAEAVISEFNDIARLNVGGTVFEVPISTLLPNTEPNYFHQLLCNDSCFPVDRDADGSIVVDRDPSSFRHVLNFLRGYRKFNLPSEDLSLLLADADFYALPQLRALLSVENDSSEGLLFSAGGGVNVERNRLRVSYTVGIIGGKFLLAGRHQVTLQIESGDYVGIGIISDSCLNFDQEFHRTLNCCVYYMTGVFYSNFPHNRKEENLPKFESGDCVSVVLDMNDRTIEYIIKGVRVKVLSCASASRLRFAVVSKLSSCIHLVQNDVLTANTPVAVPVATAPT